MAGGTIGRKGNNMRPPLAEKDIDPIAELRATIVAIQKQNREQGIPADAVSGQTAPDWLERALGAFEGSEAFEEAVRAGKKWRAAEQSLDESET